MSQSFAVLVARFNGLRSAYRELQRAFNERERTIDDLEKEVSRLRLEKARAYDLPGARLWVQEGDDLCPDTEGRRPL